MESLSVKEARNINQSSSSKGLFLQGGEAATGYIITPGPYGELTFTDPDNYFSIYRIQDLKIENPTFGQVIIRSPSGGWTNGDFYYSVSPSAKPPAAEYSPETNTLHMDEITIHQISVNQFLNDYSSDVDE